MEAEYHNPASRLFASPHTTARIESEVSLSQVYYSFGLGPADPAQLHKVVIVSPDYCIDLLKLSQSL
ncbi:hypothetical protein FVER53590_27563 [Fusarium verticillioides]|nr:hypothetical protein FVER53590_27563 [Fusarium verticillioides]